MESLRLYIGGNYELIVQMITFVATVWFCVGVATWLTGGRTTVQRRLENIEHPERIDENNPHTEGNFIVWLAQSAVKLIVPEEGWDDSQMRTRLVMAGYRSPAAVRVFIGNKIILGVLFPVVIFIAALLMGFSPAMGNIYIILLIVLAALFGFHVPDMLMLKRINKRRVAFTESFPDAMDMFVVCVEAGLGLDAAIQRVGEEMAYSHPELGTEFSILSLELRAGKSREDAMHALSDRVGINEVHQLVTLLIQAEHFGTSIADALRIHADEMRILRIQRAREKAAKLPVKLIFPIIFLIFPALFLIILGPAVIRIFNALSTMTVGGGG
jgi:tight adherence protein C